MSDHPTRRRLVHLLPASCERLLRSVRTHTRRILGSQRLRRDLQACGAIRLVIGSERLPPPSGWIETDIEYLNLLSRRDWSAFFLPGSILAIVAEHVWEHLSPIDGLAAARLCHDYLQPGGYLRIAVPDGLHPNPAYRDAVKIGGSGAGAHDHKVLYTVETLSRLLSEAGFAIEPLEYFDAKGAFHFTDWNPADGMVARSRRFDERNRGGQLHYTSLILDARKASVPHSPSTLPAR